MYIPGFTNTLMQSEYTGGPMRVGSLPSIRPSAPAIMQAAPVPAVAQSPANFELDARQAAMDGRDLAVSGSFEANQLRAQQQNLAARPRDPVTGLLLGPDGQPGFQFTTDRGRQAGYGKGNTGFIAADPNAQYRMTDERGKNRVVVEGTGVDALRQIYNTANQFNKEQGRKANYGIERLNPATGQWERVAENDPAKNVVGKIADIGLPVLGAALMPLTGGLSGALAAGLGAAGGSVLSSVVQGRSLEDTLLRGGITGLTAGALSGAGNAIGGSLAGGGAGGGAGSTIGSAVAPVIDAAGNMVLTGAAGSALGAGLGAGIGAAGGSALASAVNAAQPAPPPAQTPTAPAVPTPSPLDTVGDPITVLANRAPAGALNLGAAGAGAMANAAINSLPAAVQQQITQPEVYDQELLVTDTARPFTPPIPIPVPGALDSVLQTPAPTPEVYDQEILVTPDKNNATNIADATLASTVAGALPTGGVLPSGQTPTQGETTLEEEKNLGDKLQDRLKNLGASDYLRIAALLAPLLGGGGGRPAPGRIPAGFGAGFSPIFSGGLPAPTLPGATGNFAQRAPGALRPQTTQDWYRYGYGPSQSFFDYVPQGEENKSQAYTGYAEGGDVRDPTGGLGMPRDSYAVNGPGTGRSDEIPALLSDGEYVIDAETVALLGDGSSKAGAERLDQFRINVRRDKGSKLAKGEFSVNAKRPEHYLKGGRA